MTRPPIHVDRSGAGPRVIFVHGSMSHGSEVFETLRGMADRFTLEFVDRRGFGATPARQGGVDFDQDADDILDIAGDGAHVIGHSYGAVVAILAAARQPSRVRSLVVIEPPFFALAAKDPAVRTMRARLETVFPASTGATQGRWLSQFISALGSVVPPELAFDPRDADDIRASMSERPIWEASVDLASIRSAQIPVLVIRGDWATDPAGAAVAGAAFRAIAEALAAGTDGALLVVPEATHAPQLDRPDLVMPAIERHLAAAETSATDA